MTAIVHGWCGFVEKSNHVVSQQMVLNKLFIPDVLIDIIKDYLYINTAEVLRKFYKLHLNRSITSLWLDYTTLMDIYGRDRKHHYAIGSLSGSEHIQLQSVVCLTCGDFDHLHNNMNGCCPQEFDLEDEPIELVSKTGSEIIPQVAWEIDIPVASLMNEWDTDEETKMADYLEDDYAIRLASNAESDADDDADVTSENNNPYASQGDENQDRWEETDEETRMADNAEEDYEQRLEEFLGRRGW